MHFYNTYDLLNELNHLLLYQEMNWKSRKRKFNMKTKTNKHTAVQCSAASFKNTFPIC